MKRSCFAFVVLGLAAAPAWADWQLNGTPVTLAVEGQSGPTSVPDGAGGAIVVWIDDRTSTLDLYAQRIDATGRTMWTTNGRAVCTAAGLQFHPAAIPDGAGGAIIAWWDDRNADGGQIYAQRLSDFGDPMWTVNGVAVCTATGTQSWPTITSDLAGGAIIAWQDARGATGYDIYAQRLSASGVPQWTANGVAVAIGALDQTAPVSTTDGLGGAIIAWADQRNGGYDIYFRPISATGIPQGTNGGIPACTAVSDQSSPRIENGGPIVDFGAYIVWTDYRAGNADIHAQRVTNSGMVVWSANGVALCDATGSQQNPQIAADDAGGAIIAWDDARGTGNDVYAQRIDPAGGALWAEDGLAVHGVTTGDQDNPVLVADGQGGAVFVWRDYRVFGDTGDLYAQRVDAVGNALWSATGVPVTNAPNTQSGATLVGAGTGNAIAAWTDRRGGNVEGDIYAQRIEGRYGAWGHPEPVAESADDVPGDQGGHVLVRWGASQADRIFDPLVGYYSIWRATDTPAPAAIARTVTPAALTRDFDGPAVWAQPTAAGTLYWEWVANQDAVYLAHYSADAETRADSVAGDPATHQFRVLAHGYGPAPVKIWESGEVAGHSTDDLAPAMPIALAAERIGLDVRLTWNPVADADLAGYAIFRAATPGVIPGPATYYASAVDPELLDTAAPLTKLYYVVAADDLHGNRGAPSNEAIADYALTGAESIAAPVALAVRAAGPNPFGRETSLELGLPRAGTVRIEVHDVGGRRVRKVEMNAASGWHRVGLDGRDDAGRPLSSGVYLYRVSAGGETVQGKLVVAR